MKEISIHGRGGQGSLVLARKILGRPIMNTALLGAFAAVTKELSLEAVLRAIQSKFPGELEEKGMVYAPDYIANAGGTIYDTDRLGVGGVSHERGREKVSWIYDNMTRVFGIADRDKIPTYLAADRMAEERISQIAEVKKYVNYIGP